MKKTLPAFTIIIIILIFIFMPRKAAPTYTPAVIIYTPQPTQVEIATSSGEMVNTREQYDGFLVPKDLQ